MFYPAATPQGTFRLALSSPDVTATRPVWWVAIRGSLSQSGAGRAPEDHLAIVQRYIGASPDDVFAILANGWYYSGWVVGTSHMRAVENDWPSAGSRLFHVSGIWPAALRDETEVLEMAPTASAWS